MARRGENIRKRKDGRWEGRFIKGYGSEGKALYKSVYALSYNECKQKLLQEKVENNPYSGPKQGGYGANVKLSEILRDWLETIRVNVKPSTYGKYRNAMYNHIIPDLGGICLKKVTSILINNFLLRKSEKGRLNRTGGLSNSTVHVFYVILTSALAFASGDSTIFSMGFKFKSQYKSDREILTLEQSEQNKLEQVLLNDIDSSKFGILLCLYTGMRLGEICSLRWEDVDRVNQVIKIRNTVSRIQIFDEGAKAKTKLMIGVPKSKSSVRDIPIPSCIMGLLNKHFPHSRNGYVLTSGANLLDPRTYQYRFKGYLKVAGIADIHFHAIRATFATNCINAGVDAKSLSEFLGHAGVSITLNKYVHLSKDMKQKQIDRLSNNRGQNWGTAQSIYA